MATQLFMTTFKKGYFIADKTAEQKMCLQILLDLAMKNGHFTSDT